MPEQTQEFEQLLKKAEKDRGFKLSADLIRHLGLDLSGLTVLTECASGPYAYTPIMAALAGARVYAIGRDSRHGTFEENASHIGEMAKTLGIEDLLHCFDTDMPLANWQKVDIMTNSGFLRPITSEKIKRLKPTAVLPLMWETWEWRPGEIDLSACQQAGIPVIGTNERYEKNSMVDYPGMMVLKLLFSLGIEAVHNHLVLLGGGFTGKCIANTFEKLELNFDWFTATGSERAYRCYPYAEIRRLLEMKSPDAVVCAEHTDPRQLLGPDARLSFAELATAHPVLRWGHFMGNIDVEDLQKSGLLHYPQHIAPFGYMTFDAGKFGIRLALQLNAQGLKVGEMAARARRNGHSIEETIAATVDAGIGMDFEGGLMNIKDSETPTH
ncbi:MAG: hypothetical protein ACFB10_11375 [Salibacteraceae bacterium]